MRVYLKEGTELKLIENTVIGNILIVVPKRTGIGPLLFHIYMSDLFSYI